MTAEPGGSDLDLTEVVAGKIKDAYYHARDHGGTMHTAGDDAAAVVVPLIQAQVRERIAADIETRLLLGRNDVVESWVREAARIARGGVS